MTNQHADAPSRGEALTVFSADSMGRLAYEDLVAGLRRPDLWWGLAVFDIRQRFKRSMLGPLWLTLSMGIMVLSLALVFGTLFQQDMTELMPHIAVGLIFWGLMTSTIIESCGAFTAAEGYIRNVPMPTSTHVLRVFARNIIIFGFNLVIYLGIWLLYLRSLNVNYLLFVPGLILLLANVAWFSTAMALICTRYRDIPQIISSAIQVIFFLTPVFWTVQNLPERPAFVHFNPFFHMLEVVRSPLLGAAPQAESWLVLILLLVIGIPFTLWLYRRVYARLAYWI
ncbi:ABC transporter permease [Devosia submarina]|uniref:ABC transporter permease n=1 Tax=Devosia submarina TaxID=1173082 RepID=UPI00130066E3|nr:ABC transporter permease [Devosia submarina]